MASSSNSKAEADADDEVPEETVSSCVEYNYNTEQNPNLNASMNHEIECCGN